MARSIQTLGRQGLPIREFPQTVENCTRMGQTIFDLVRGRNLAVYPAPDLREHALNTVVVESARGWRIAKDKAAKKIDGVVALSMACVALGQRPASFPPFVFSHVTTSADRAKAYWERKSRETDPDGRPLVTTPSGQVEAYYDPRGLEPTAPAEPIRHDVHDAAHRTECRACRHAWRTT